MLFAPASRDVANLDVFEPSVASPFEIHIKGPRLRQVDSESASQTQGWPSGEVGGGPFPVLENVAHGPGCKSNVAIGDPPAATVGQVKP